MHWDTVGISGVRGSLRGIWRFSQAVRAPQPSGFARRLSSGQTVPETAPSILSPAGMLPPTTDSSSEPRHLARHLRSTSFVLLLHRLEKCKVLLDLWCGWPLVLAVQVALRAADDVRAIARDGDTRRAYLGLDFGIGENLLDEGSRLITLLQRFGV